jgi:hypothetical protein
MSLGTAASGDDFSPKGSVAALFISWLFPAASCRFGVQAIDGRL